jgi:hypothetical protein
MIILLLYTLCSSPQYLTLIDGENVGVWGYEIESLLEIQEVLGDREFYQLKIPLDDVNKGQCS